MFGDSESGGELVSRRLERNKERIFEIYQKDKNKDFKVREFVVTYRGKSADAFAIFFDGMVDTIVMNDSILKPLMLLGSIVDTERKADMLDAALEALLPHNQIDSTSDIKKVVEAVNTGGCAIFIDGVGTAITADVKGFPRRSVDTSNNEMVIKGPQQGFIESARANVALLRKILSTADLISEEMTIGDKSPTLCSLLYLEGVASREVVDGLRDRLKSIIIDYIFDCGELEQILENKPWSPFAQVMSTERPDLAAISLSEGQVVVILDGSPAAIIAPISITELAHAADDKYLRLPFAGFISSVRMVAILIAFLLSGIFVAVSCYHHEALPIELLYAIEATRDKVPFITVMEVIFLELAFELIREAAIRVQGVMGGTLGIVGGLILGQAAFEARIVSPVTIVIVALGGLCSFAIPNYYLEFSTRIIKYVFIVLGYFAGFLGIAAGLAIVGIIACDLQSFGVPYLAPFAIRSGNYSKSWFLTRKGKRRA